MAERTNPHTEIIIGARDDASPVFDAVGGSARRMGDAVEQSATKAGASVGKIGDNATPAAGKIDGAAKSIIQSIERATAALKAGEKGSAAYFDALANQRGVSADIIKPYTDGLREAEAAQRAAMLGQQGMQMSAKQTAAALRGVPAQITDIVVSLQGGQAPLTVLLQQGGQLKDMFGGIVPAARALGSAVLGMVNPYTLAAAAVGAIAIAYYQAEGEAAAFNKTLILSGNAVGLSADSLGSMAASIDAATFGISQGKAAEALNALAASGDIAGDKLQRYTSLAIEFERAGGGAVEEVGKAFSALAADPLAASEKLNKSTNYLTAEIYNQIKALQDQGRNADAARIAQDAYANMLDDRTPKLAENITGLAAAWRDVKDSAAEAWDEMVNGAREKTLAQQVGEKEKELERLKGFWPYVTESSPIGQQKAALESQIAAGRALLDNNKKFDEQQRQNNISTQAAIDLSKESAKFDSDLEKQRRAAAQATELYTTALAAGNLTEAARAQLEKDYLKTVSGITAAKEEKSKATRKENKDLDAQTKILSELNGVSSTYYKDLAAARAQLAKGNISEAQYVAYVEDLLKKQPFAIALAKEEAEARKVLNARVAESAKAYEEAIAAMDAQVQSSWQSLNQYTQSTKEQAEMLELELSVMGQAAEARALTIEQKKIELRLNRELEAIRLTPYENDSQRAAAILQANDAAAQARQNLLTQSAIDAAKLAEAEWAKTSQTIGDTLADYIMGGGKDAAQYLKRLFSTLVLQPIVEYGTQSLMGALGFGKSGSAVGSVLQGGNVGSTVLNNAGLIGAGYQAMFGASVGASTASLGVANAVGAVGGDALGALIAGNGGWAGVAVEGATAAGAAAGSSAASGFASTLAAAAPWLLGGAALLAIVPSMLNGGTPHAGAASMYYGGGIAASGAGYSSSAGVTDTYDKAMQAPVDALAMSIGSALDGLAKRFDQVAGYSVQVGYKSDNDDPSAGKYIIADPTGEIIRKWEAYRGGEFGGISTGERYDSDPTKGFDQYLQSVTAATIPIVQGIVPGWADNLLDQLSASLGIAGAIAAGDKNPWKQMTVSGQEAFDALQTTLAQIAQIDAAFDALGKTMVVFADMTDEMKTALLGGLGGMEGFSAAAQSYYANFYSEQERYTDSLASMQEALAGIGVDVDPAMGSEAKAQYRALVEAAFADGNEVLATQLLALSGAFSQTADAAQEVIDATQEQAQALTQSAIDLLSRLPGGAADARDMQAAALAQQASGIWGGIDVAALQSTILSVNSQELEAYLREAWEAADTVEAKQAVVDFGLAMADFVGDAKSAEEAIVGLSDVMRGLLTERKRLEAELLRASGDETGYTQALRAIATEGYTEAEVAAWDYNEQLRAQINALDAATQAQEEAASNQLAIARQVVEDQRQLAMDAAAAVREQISDVKSRLKEIEAESDWVRTQAGMGYGQAGVGAADKFTVSLFSGYEGYAANMAALAQQYDGMTQAQKDMLSELESEESRHKGTVQRLDAILTEGKSQVAQLMSLEVAVGILQGAVVGAIHEQGSAYATPQQNAPVAKTLTGDPVKDSYQGVIDLLQSQRGNAVAALAGDEAASKDFFAAMHAAGITMFDDVANHSIEAFDKEVARLQSVVDGMRTIVPTEAATTAAVTGDTPRVVYEDGWRGNYVDEFALIKMLQDAAGTSWGEAVYGDDIREYGEKFADRIAQFLPAYDPAYTQVYERITGKAVGSTGTGVPSDIEQAAVTPELTIAEYKQMAQLQQQYWQLLGDEASIRAAVLDTMHPQLHFLQQQVWAQEDQNRINQERSGLEQQLLQLQGDTNALRALDLQKLDPSNRALQERIWMLEEEQRQQKTTDDLNRQILELQGDTEALRNLAIAGMNLENIALYDKVQALTKAKQVEQEQAGLQDRLNQLTLTSSQLRALELQKLDPSNRSLQERIWLLEDEARVTEERNGLMTSLYQALGNTAALRAEQLESLDPSNRGLKQQIWQIEDAKAALEKALQAESDSANAAQQAAQERVSAIQGIFDLIKSNVQDLYETAGDATKRWTAAQANAFIDNALVNARATGYMPEQDDLAEAIAGARAGLDQQYVSAEDQKFANLELAGKLAELQDISGGQLTVAERQLRAAEEQVAGLDAMQAQGRALLESLSGNTTAVLSVGDAIANLSAAVLAAKAAAPQSAAAAAVTSQLSSVYGAGNVTAGSGYNSVTNSFVDGSSASRVVSADGKSIVLDVGAGWSQQQVANQIAANLAAYEKIGNQANYDTLLAYAQDKKIPGFASGGLHAGGLRIVGENGPELEATGPSRIWNAQQLGRALTGSNSARLESLVETLTAEVKRLQSIVNDGNREQRRTANAVNGNPEMPMLVETV